MIGPIVNSSAVAIGGLLGGGLGNKIPARVRSALPMTFGLASMALGIALIIKIKFMPAVILSLLFGSLIGELFSLEKAIAKFAGKARGLIERIAPNSGAGMSQEEFLDKYVAMVVLFCASGTGIFGSMNEGMTGDPTILIAKSLLDLFTASIFATSLGFALVLVAIPQFIIQVALYFGAHQLLPLTTPDMIADFSACGGAIMFATGFRICGIKSFPVANMLPALVLVMPISHLWSTVIMPLL